MSALLNRLNFFFTKKARRTHPGAPPPRRLPLHMHAVRDPRTEPPDWGRCSPRLHLHARLSPRRCRLGRRIHTPSRWIDVTSARACTFAPTTAHGTAPPRPLPPTPALPRPACLQRRRAPRLREGAMEQGERGRHGAGRGREGGGKNESYGKRNTIFVWWPCSLP